jgi:hypothetical protein
MASQSHRMSKKSGVLSRPVGKSPFQSTGEEGWVKKERKVG